MEAIANILSLSKQAGVSDEEIEDGKKSHDINNNRDSLLLQKAEVLIFSERQEERQTALVLLLMLQSKKQCVHAVNLLNTFRSKHSEGLREEVDHVAACLASRMSVSTREGHMSSSKSAMSGEGDTEEQPSKKRKLSDRCSPRPSEVDFVVQQGFSEKLLHEISLVAFCTAPIATAIVTESGSVIVNKAVERLLGYSPAEINTVETWCENVYYPYGKKVVQLWRQVVAQRIQDVRDGKPLDDESQRIGQSYTHRSVSMKRKDGNRMYMMAVVKPVNDKPWMHNGEQIVEIWNLVDAHEQAYDVVQLQEKYLSLRMGIDALSDKVFVTNLDGILTDLNKAAAQLLMRLGIDNPSSAALADILVHDTTDKTHDHSYCIDIAEQMKKLREITPSEAQDSVNAIGAFGKMFILVPSKEAPHIARSTEYSIKIIPIWRRFYGKSTVGLDSLYRMFVDANVVPDPGNVQFEADGMIGFVVSLENISTAQKAMEGARLVKERSAFLSVVSHEMRTPLNGIVGMIDSLRPFGEEMGDPAYIDALDTLECCSETMLSLINNVLDLSRLESGAVQMNASPHMLIRQVRALFRLEQVSAAEKGVKLALTISDDSGILESHPVLVDWHRIRHVLFNFLSNAIKFTPSVTSSGSPGLVELRIVLKSLSRLPSPPPRPSSAASTVSPSMVDSSSEEVPKSGSTRSNGVALPPVTAPSSSPDPNSKYAHVEFAVVDNGIGIEKSNIHKIFKEFSQADSSVERRYGGSGLGLAISKRILHLHGSHVVVDSSPQQGSSFSFELALPVCESSSSHAHASSSEYDSSSAPSSPHDEGMLGEVKSTGDSAWEPMVSSLALRQIRCNLGDATSLVVDDDKINCKVLQLTLKKNKMQKGVVAMNGAEALHSFASSLSHSVHVLLGLCPSSLPASARDSAIADVLHGGGDSYLGPTLVFMDVQMPLMDGIEATRRMFSSYYSALRVLVSPSDYSSQLESESTFAKYLEEDGQSGLFLSSSDVISDYRARLSSFDPPLSLVSVCQFPRVIGLSADVQEASRNACARAGMLSFLSKPFTHGRVLSAVLESAIQE